MDDDERWENQSLQAVYREKASEKPLDLETFLKYVVDGQYGTRSDQAIKAFLEAQETAIIASIETMISARPELAAQRQQRIQQTKEMIDALIERYTSR